MAAPDASRRIGTTFLTASDPQQLADAVAGWSQRYQQLARGPFEGSLADLRWQTGRVFRERLNAPVLQEGCADTSGILLVLPLDVGGSCWAMGREIDAPVLGIAPASQPWLFRSPPSTDLVCIQIEAESVRALHPAWQQGDRWLQPRLAHDLPRHAQVLAPLLALSVLALERASSGETRSDTVAELEDGVLDLLSGMPLASGSGDDLPNRYAQRCRVVRRARDCVLANPLQPPSVSDLCRQLHLSRRSLQLCLQEVLGLSPLQFIKAMRLQAVRSRLLSRRTAVSVQDAASEWGFFHLSQFGLDYRRWFGELPSQTARRNGPR